MRTNKKRATDSSQKQSMAQQACYALHDFLEMRSPSTYEFNQRLIKNLIGQSAIDLTIYPLTCFLFNGNLVVIRNGEQAKVKRLLVVDAKRNCGYSCTDLMDRLQKYL